MSSSTAPAPLQAPAALQAPRPSAAPCVTPSYLVIGTDGGLVCGALLRVEVGNLPREQVVHAVQFVVRSGYASGRGDASESAWAVFTAKRTAGIGSARWAPCSRSARRARAKAASSLKPRRPAADGCASPMRAHGRSLRGGRRTRGSPGALLWRRAARSARAGFLRRVGLSV